jgi:hypothetical protein
LNSFLNDLVLVVLGAALAVAGERALQSGKDRKQRRDALRRLNSMADDVRRSVAHGHDFHNKSDWSTELNDLANEDRSWLGGLYEPLKRISWEIRDRSFNHKSADASEYCCDELILDLTLLQLKILPQIPLRRSVREKAAQHLAHDVLVCWHGVMPSDDTEQVATFLQAWRAGNVTVDRKYAMSSVLGHTR